MSHGKRWASWLNGGTKGCLGIGQASGVSTLYMYVTFKCSRWLMWMIGWHQQLAYEYDKGGKGQCGDVRVRFLVKVGHGTICSDK